LFFNERQGDVGALFVGDPIGAGSVLLQDSGKLSNEGGLAAESQDGSGDISGGVTEAFRKLKNDFISFRACILTAPHTLSPLPTPPLVLPSCNHALHTSWRIPTRALLP